MQNILSTNSPGLTVIPLISSCVNEPVIPGSFVMHYLNLSLENIEGEIWLPVKGAEHKYHISNFGRVKTLGRAIKIHNGVRVSKDAIRKQFIDIGGYCVLSISYDAGVKYKKTHCLVAEVFMPNPDNKPNLNHIDGIKHNNHIPNLEWVTKSENMRHAYANNLIDIARGERNHMTNLTSTDVLNIFYSIEPIDTITERYGIKKETVYAIRRGQNWKHITGKEYNPKKKQL